MNIENNQELTYYTNDTEAKPRDSISLVDALVSNITQIKDRDHSFSIQAGPPTSKSYFLSSTSYEESNEWRDAIISSINKGKNRTSKLNFSRHTQGLQPQNKNVEEVDDENDFLNPNSSFYDMAKFQKKRYSNAAQGNVSHQVSQSSPFKHTNRFSNISQVQVNGRSPISETSIDERIVESKKIKQKVYNKSKLREKSDMGQIGNEQLNMLNTIQKHLQEDIGQIQQKSSSWECIDIQNGILIQAQNPKTHQLCVDKKGLKSYIQNFVMLMIAFWVVRTYIYEMSLFWLGIITSLLNYKKMYNIFSLQSKYSLLKARTIIKGDAEVLGKNLIDGFQNKKSYNFDFMALQSRIVSQDEEKHVFVNEETLDLPSDYFVKNFLEKRIMKIQTYWCIDETGTFYVIRKAIPPINLKSGKHLSNIQEAFVFVPLDNKTEKCLVYFFSEFNYGSQGYPLIFNSHTQDQIKLLRMNVLASFIEFNKNVQEMKAKQIYNSSKQTSNNNIFNNIDDNLINLRVSQGQGFNNMNQGSEIKNKNSIFVKDDTTQGKKLRENPNNILLKPGQRMSISERFPGYCKMENGALWCHNEEELSAQSGIFVEVLQRAGKNMMQKQGIVSVSLPVRIFEQRSALDRISDLWCTGPLYLKRAAIEKDLIERLKLVVTFIVSGMHTVASQKKPFNPILGETYQGIWPDGTNIFVEHVSHHPPISCFLVEHPDGLFVFEGAYEYTGKITDLGNSLMGRQVGKNRVKFQDGTQIQFEYPFMKISGLLFGKRTIQWIGGIEFDYQQFGLKAKLEFSKEGSIFSRKSLPIDCFQGSIQKFNQDVCKIEGSWLESIKFDGKTYWELETSDTIKPAGVEKCIPSDARYREDSIAFGNGDLILAQSEKERLEVLQRHDRKLREEADKKRKNNLRQ